MERNQYQKPTLDRLGTFRDITLAGGQFICGDGASPYSRYPM